MIYFDNYLEARSQIQNVFPVPYNQESFILTKIRDRLFWIKEYSSKSNMEKAFQVDIPQFRD